MDDKQYELYIRPFVDHYSLHQWLADTYSMSLDNCTQDNAARYFLFLIIEEAEKIISEFIDRYNREWMLERLGYLSPNEALNGYNSVVQKSA